MHGRAGYRPVCGALAPNRFALLPPTDCPEAPPPIDRPAPSPLSAALFLPAAPRLTNRLQRLRP
jgi:hypothetical protein